MDQVLDLLPEGAKTRRLAKMIVPHLLEDLEEIPEEIVNQAASFIILALARVWNPHAQVVIVDVGQNQVTTGKSERSIGEHDSPPSAALPGPLEPESDGGDGSAEPTP